MNKLFANVVRILVLCLAAALMLSACAFNPTGDKEASTTKAPTSTDDAGDAGDTAATVNMDEILQKIDSMESSDYVDTPSRTEYVRISVEGYGDIVLRLLTDVAPLSVANFQDLVGQGFYDGLIFHRVIKDFMIQGGGFRADGTQKESGKTIKGEFSANGITNNLKHVRGVLSMARTSVKDSATSQFFICHQTSSHLDGQYAAFGYVVAGMDVVDAIANVATNTGDMPLSNVVITSIRFVTYNEEVESEGDVTTEAATAPELTTEADSTTYEETTEADSTN